jgi:hypothetical protein
MSEIPADHQGFPSESGEDSPTPDSEILGITTFDDI